MTTLGYYLTCDDAQCVDCYERNGGKRGWSGFEGWPAPLKITSGKDSESDTPTHCMTCEALIPHQLTDDGMEYVRETLEDELRDGMGRKAIVRAWVQEYLPEQAELVADWPTRDQWSPKEKEQA